MICCIWVSAQKCRSPQGERGLKQADAETIYRQYAVAPRKGSVG